MMEAKGRLLCKPVFKVSEHDGEITIRVDCEEFAETWFELRLDTHMLDMLKTLAAIGEKRCTAIDDVANAIQCEWAKKRSAAPGEGSEV